MVELLALIGLGLLLWMASTGLKRIGSAIDRVGDNLLLSDSKIQGIRARARKDETKEKVQEAVSAKWHAQAVHAKADRSPEAQEDFMQKARDEIDELTSTDE